MKKHIFLFLLIGLPAIVLGYKNYLHIPAMNERPLPVNSIPLKKHHEVAKRVLKNGMTVLVYEDHRTPRVSIQIWYNVGSKDEGTGEKGRAHLIEHMLFKGTDAPEGTACLRLSESDTDTIVHTLSGSCNAWTSYDYTGYMYNLPSQNWKEILPIAADYMRNCAFKDEHLNSEMKAVIQELKMYRDSYARTAELELISDIFSDHPYHVPIIGYKQDLWTASGDELRSFYHKHYVPNNAVFVIVGDVNAQEVFTEVDRYFGDIAPDFSYKRPEFHFERDIKKKQVTLYRDVQQPFIALAFVVPGMNKKMDHLLDLLAWILGRGKASRLRQKIVDELQLATSLSASSWGLFEHGIFFIDFEPKETADIPKIIDVINQEIQSIITNGFKKDELERAIKQLRMNYYCTVMEDIESLASQIGLSFLATGDENYAFSYLIDPSDDLDSCLINLISAYMRPSVMHQATVLPIPEEEKEHWNTLQKESDEEDNRILSARARTTPVDPPVYAAQVTSHPARKFDFPKAVEAQLSNGIQLFYHNNNNTPKIDLILSFKAEDFFDPKGQEGLYNFLSRMMREGTRNYTAAQLAHELETRGMTLRVYPGGIALSMLVVDLEKGLELIYEIVTECTFDKKAIEKVRAQILVDIKNFWDEPKSFAGQLVREQIYKGQPYGRNLLGTTESIKSITRNHLVDFYKKFITPRGCRIAIVGDLQKYNIQQVLEKYLGKWTGPEIEPIECPALVTPQATEINYPISRDQVVLCMAGLSVNRTHPDYDKLILFDQILGGGVLGSMHSRLFALRQATGLFYTIFGSVVTSPTQFPGMVLIKTIVSLDRLQEAEEAIKKTLETVVDSITEHELHESKEAIANSLVSHFESNMQIASVFLFLDKYKLPNDYFDTRAINLNKITLDEVKEATRKVLQVKDLITVRVGRL